MENPASNTRIKFTSDRIQHYSTSLYKCSSCGEEYYPKVHSQSYLVMLGALVVGVLIVVAVFLISDKLLYLYGALALVYYYWYSKKKRIPKGKSEKLKYGDVILECPNCGNDKTEAL